ncbi:DUF6415 family natural product biosynthesis protein [Streptomyces sp. NPDC049097]|uniref:DUF6415 family natural product biosynthesis protein n=1 Tax=Streptomyces sp. NPDC049097 TaxID=3155497 RepID=UPI003425D0E8
MHATAQSPAAEDIDQTPPDVATMRATVDRLLDPATPTEPAPAADEVATLTLRLRGHLAVVMPEVERLAGSPPESVAQYCALACLGEARGKLRAQPSPAPGGDLAYARRLARALWALCDHYEALQPAD